MRLPLFALVFTIVAVVTGGPDIPIPVLGVPAFLNTALLVRLVESIDYPVEKVVIVHNGVHKGVASVIEDIRAKHPEFVILTHPENLGCASSWNAIIGINPRAPYYIISNDDVAFRPGALRIFAAAIRQQAEKVAQGRSNRVVIFPLAENMPTARAMWSCYALLQHAIATVGKFDGNLWPAYHEDYDFSARLSRAGLWHMQVPEARLYHGPKGARWMSGLTRAVIHQKKDAQVQLYKEQQGRQRGGAPYFALKWGVGWSSGILDEVEGYWNQTCNHTETTRTCSPAPPLHYAHPFNDPSLPLSVFFFDPVYRRCLRKGASTPCVYNRSLLPHPERLPDGPWNSHTFVWMHNTATA
eukprot:GGOE01052336.1.p1 GENE.GGOE01052336.1~~GGOE01052336.1.p1  ORF type:complete len:355 (-),score=85.03 GGOE01052336.1:388-1452(-)